MFERLTKKVFIDGEPYFVDTVGNDILAENMTPYQIGVALKRLAAYEDSGLLPEEILSGKELAEIACAMSELKRYKEAEHEGRIIVSPVRVGDTVKVDARTMPYNYLHPLDCCGEFANCKVIGFVKTKNQTYMKLVALYPSRMNRRGYLRYSIGAIGKTVFTD